MIFVLQGNIYVLIPEDEVLVLVSEGKVFIVVLTSKGKVFVRLGFCLERKFLVLVLPRKLVDLVLGLGVEKNVLTTSLKRIALKIINSNFTHKMIICSLWIL